MKRREMSPPAWAEWVLLTLLPADRAESESGDVLEAYRDEQLPARGRAGADWWYVRQVGAVFFRAYSRWLAPLVALFVLGDVVNAYRLPIAARVGPPVTIALLFTASFHGSWRSKKLGGGVLAAMGTGALLWLFMATWWMTTWYPFSFVQEAEPYWIAAWQSSAAPGESFTRWIFWDNVGATIISGIALSVSALLVGLAGGIVGVVSRQFYAARR